MLRIHSQSLHHRHLVRSRPDFEFRSLKKTRRKFYRGSSDLNECDEYADVIYVSASFSIKIKGL